jgi:hypothetical protein
MLQVPILNLSIFTGLKISTNEQAPCESCHDVTVSLTQPSEIKPLSLTFPFPILAKNVQATLHRKSRHVDLLLEKSLLEPWPCEFHSKKSKWIIDDLVPWENVPLTSEDVFSSLEHHLSSQFSMTDIKFFLQSRQLIPNNMDLCQFILSSGSALHSLRLKLGSLMARVAEFVSYGRNDDRYLLKLHLPLLTSPMGTPILLITALDQNYMKKFLKEISPANPTVPNEVMDHLKICQKFFPPMEDRLVVEAESEEELQLFRFLLRLNSTR